MKRKNTKFKSAVFGVAAIATSVFIGLSAAACTPSSPDDKDEDTVKKLDEQEIKNGNFEFYNDNDGLYPISTPDNWSAGTSGNSSASMSGVINVNPTRWNYITDENLAQTLEDNNELKAGDENKKNYNGALSDDLPYVNPHSALEDDDPEEGYKAKDFIKNPFTHKFSYEVDENGEVTKYHYGDKVLTPEDVYENDDKELCFKDENDEEVVLDTSVLMVHTYRKNYYTGTESYYKSSTTISLEANTAAEMSLWVKTSDLTFDGATAKRTSVESERGAYIKVDTAVGGNNLDSFKIKNINTAKLNPENENNGWVQYTVYVEASAFATTTVTVTLGLGESGVYTVEGYAFFDDVELKPVYLNKAKLAEESEDFETKITPDNTCYPMADDAKMNFRVDTVTIRTDNDEGKKVYFYNSADRHFFIDLAHTTAASPFEISKDNTSAGLTVEESQNKKYVTTTGNTALPLTDIKPTANSGAGNAIVPSTLGKGGISITNDLLATVNIGEDWTSSFSFNGNNYNDLLTKNLKSAYELPGVTENGASTLVMLSALGAAYEAQITGDEFTVENDGYMLISFWVKTSDMNGKTAATVTVADCTPNYADSKNKKASFTVDSTTLDPVKIGDEEVYDGWAKCFIRVSNTSGEPKNFKIKVNFGQTSINGTTPDAHTSGWLALTNISVVNNLSEDVYDYSSGVSNVATLTYIENDIDTTTYFDSELGDNGDIKTDVAKPSSYTGVYGGSSSVIVGGIDSEKYVNGAHDETVKSSGIINKNYLDAYKDKDWYKAITQTADSTDWDEIFGKGTTQPLIIVNSAKTFDDPDLPKGAQVYNYGYVAQSASVSANSYAAVSVKVLVSKGAIANIYLVENNEVLRYELPKYTFWYDDDGNVLKGKPDEDAKTLEEKKANIAYTLRSDGLYENGDGKLYANIYNLTRHYDYDFENEKYFDKDGNPVLFQNLKDDVIYYSDKNCTTYAPHYLIAGGNENNKIYMYGGIDEKGETYYYYMENLEANKNKVVYGLDTELATPRTTNDDETTPYQFTIDARTSTSPHYKLAGQWVTVTFYIQTGSEAKDYTLELWSGEREKTTSDMTDGSYVFFNKSNITSSDASSYSEARKGYTDQIINDYKLKAILKDIALKDNDLNINELKDLVGEKSTLFDYIASYYTFSLYDSSYFIPFNATTADEDQAGYPYNYSDYDESLAILKVEDYIKTDKSGKEVIISNPTMSMFVDYSVIDKDIDPIGEPVVEPSETDSGDTNNKNDTNFWLLLASILLVVAIIIAMVALLVRYLIKNRKKSKSGGKNNYNFAKNKRYVKKYVKANGDAPELKDEELDESLLSDKPEETETTEESVSEKPEEAVEETPAETKDAAAETEASEAPAEEASETEDKKSDGDDKTE
ncbi:MAG: hypothetical protein K2N47_01415, partial [Clostridia bacterium]|nr:hypothetical protein [Clostridia bacterium]